MAVTQRNIDAELIRYRIKKRMAGRRDLLLHIMVYVGVAVLFRLNVYWIGPIEYFFLGGLWTIPLALHGLRYYYRCGRGALARADEIERAIDEQLERTALDEDEELLIEERVSKRVTARRVLAAHGLASAMMVLMYSFLQIFGVAEYSAHFWQHLLQIFALFGGAVALHGTRFFFVHGRTPSGRALKIDAAVENEWHQSRERSRLRRERHERREAQGELDLGELRGRRLRLTDEGEFDDDIKTGPAAASRSVGAS